MKEKQVEVIKKTEGPIIRDQRLNGKPFIVIRKRVEDMCVLVRMRRNSTEFQIAKDEEITGIKANKRDELLRMIDNVME